MNELFNMYFGIIEDPRCKVNVVYSLVDILKLVMITVLCGIDAIDAIVAYGNSKIDFLTSEFGIEKNPINFNIE